MAEGDISGRYDCMICGVEIASLERRTVCNPRSVREYEAWCFTALQDVEHCVTCGTGQGCKGARFTWSVA